MTSPTPTTEVAMDTERKVDVLAVLDRQMEFTVASDYSGAIDDHRDMVEARDAVAQLIEAAKELLAMNDKAAHPETGVIPPGAFWGGRSHLRAALSRLGASA